MAAASAPRVQLLIFGKFLVLVLAALCLLGGGYYWYGEQQQNEKRFQAPPYFVNRGATIIRSCQQCLDIDNKLKPQPEWKIGSAQETPPAEQRWFLAVEDTPMPQVLAGQILDLRSQVI